MIGPKDGTILEIRWTPELRAKLAEWLWRDGQLPAATAGDFTPERLSELLLRQRETLSRAVETLGALLAHRATPALDADIAALRPPRPMPEPLTLPMPAQTTLP